MLIIKESENSTLDKEELVQHHVERKRNELGRELTEEELSKITKRIDSLLKSFITNNFLAYESDKLVGWLGVRDAIPCTMNLYEYHPIIFSDINKIEIAQKLIHYSINYATKKNISNVRVFTDATKEYLDTYLEIKEYFLNSGMIQTHTVLCMENKITEETLKVNTLDSDYRVEPMNLQDRDKLLDCYENIFATDTDHFTSSLDEEESKYWNFTFHTQFTDDAKVVKKDDEVVGIAGVHDYDSFIELGPIGVLPEHRGKGLGKVLMEEILSSLFKRGIKESYLEVDITNTSAIKLYEKYGFIEVSQKHGFLWRAADQNN